MPRAFEATVESPVTVEQVHRAFGDEDYWFARFEAFDVTCTLDLLRVDDDGTVTVTATQDLRHGGLPRPVAAVYPGDLKIVNTEIWQPANPGRVRGKIRVQVDGAPGSGEGLALLEPNGNGSQLSLTGTVEFKVPLVGGRVEKYLANHFAEHIPEIQRFTTEWITGGHSNG